MDIVLDPIERFHSRDQHLCKFIETKGSVYMRKEFNSLRICLVHQHGRHFIVLEHQYGRRDVRWKRSIKSVICLRGGNPSVNWNPASPPPPNLHLNPVKLRGINVTRLNPSETPCKKTKMNKPKAYKYQFMLLLYSRGG